MPGEEAVSQASLERERLATLRRLIAEVLPGNRFYSGRIRQVGLDRYLPDLQHFSSVMPLTTKAEIAEDQANHPPFGTHLTYPIDRYTRLSKTSGTSGRIIRWADTAKDWSWMLENWKRVYRAAGVTAGDRLYFAFSFGPYLGFWTAFEAAASMGCLCVSGGGRSSIERIRDILEDGVTIVCCTPSYALRLAEVAEAEHADIKHAAVRGLIVAGEPGGSVPTVRERIAKAWGSSIVADHHGMTETGPVSYQCPANPGVLHVIDSSYIAEVIDPADNSAHGRRLLPGQRGELVLTTLGRFGSPVLRYRTGDMVELGAAGPCACGTLDTALAGGILGRVDDMVIVRGVNLYPSALENQIRAIDGIAEYRVRLSDSSSLAELVIEIEPCPDWPQPDELAARLETNLRTAFSLRTTVKVLKPGSLPRFEMKASRWVREGLPIRHKFHPHRS